MTKGQWAIATNDEVHISVEPEGAWKLCPATTRNIVVGKGKGNFMTDAQILALIAGGAGVLGGLVGARGAVVGQFLTARAQRRQDRIRLAVQLGTADYQARLDSLKSEKLLPPGQRAIALALYVDYHKRLLDALDQGPLTPDAIRRLHKDHTEVKAALDDMPPYMIPPTNLPPDARTR